MSINSVMNICISLEYAVGYKIATKSQSFSAICSKPCKSHDHDVENKSYVNSQYNSIYIMSKGTKAYKFE